MNELKYKIIIDSREKENKHIIEAFKKNNIEFDTRGLPIGDYIIEGGHKYVPNVAIERKGSLDELIGNLLDTATKDEKGNNRFVRELIRANQCNKKVILLIENGNYYKDLLIGNYRSKIKPRAIRGMIISLEAKYPNLSIVGIDKELVGSYIHSILYYRLREDLKDK